MNMVLAVIIVAGLCSGLAFFIGMRNKYYRAFTANRESEHKSEDCDQCKTGYLCPDALKSMRRAAA